MTSISITRSVIVSLLMMGAFAFLMFFGKSEPVKTRKAFADFPLTLANWQGTVGRFDDRVYQMLGVDDSILVSYRNPDGNMVELYVGYYESQRQGDMIHSPKNCLPGSGWNITHNSLEEITIPGNSPQNIQVIKLILEKGASKQVVLYWFQSRGRFVASEYWQKIYLVVDAIFRNRTDDSFVRLISPVRDNDVNTATECLKNFSGSLIPVLKLYLPD